MQNIEEQVQNMEVGAEPPPVENMEIDAEPVILVAPMAAPIIAAPTFLMQREWNEPGTQLDHTVVIRNVLPFLKHKRMKKLRLLSYNWNMTILESPEFNVQLTGRIRGVWYRKADRLNFQTTPKWNTLYLNRFQFYRHSCQFRLYWQSSVEFLDTLIICRVSLECDGFIFLLSNCPVLRSLTLEICQLRDLDDLHSAAAIAKPRRGGYCLPPKPITRDLSHLKLKSINRIEQCFMNYLIERTGNLELFQVTSCFVPTDKDKINNTPHLLPEFEARYTEFERNLLRLLEKNEDEMTLTQFTYTNNYFYTSFFRKIADRETFFNIPSLTLEVDTPDQSLPNYDEMIAFSGKCQGVETLSLKLHKDIPVMVLQNFLEPHRETLQKLYIGVKGNTIRTHLNLDFLKEFTVLDDLEIEDTKPLVLKKIRPIIGGNRRIDGLEDSTEVVRELITNYGSGINPSFMNVLPPELKKLSLNHYVTPIDPLHPIDPSVATWQSLRKLSKLEIRGPWILTITGIIGAISQELTQLETLALTACGLEDTHLTGLDESITLDMYNSTYAGMEVFRAIPNPTGEQVTDAIRGRMQPDTTDWNAPRHRLSDLPNLSNLDLSLNPGISDISLFDAIRSPRIRTLNLYACTKISDDGMHFLTLYNPGLEVLNVKHCRKVSQRGLNKLVGSCRLLKTIYSTRIPAYNRSPRSGDPRTLNETRYHRPEEMHPRYADIVVTTDEKYAARLTL